MVFFIEKFMITIILKKYLSSSNKTCCHSSSYPIAVYYVKNFKKVMKVMKVEKVEKKRKSRKSRKLRKSRKSSYPHILFYPAYFRG